MSRSLRPNTASSAGTVTRSDIDGTTLPLGRSKCAISIGLPPRARISSTVGLIRSIRVASVTVPFSTGTLISTRTSTRLPSRSMSSSVFQPIAAVSSCESAPVMARRPRAVNRPPLAIAPVAPRPVPKPTKEHHMAEITDPENTILMELKDGTVTIELMPKIAPEHCARMKELARAGAYDNVAFHRVIDGFMAQTGDVEHANMEKDYNPRRAGTGGSDLPDLKAEFSKIPHDRGTLGAARSQNPNSANSQFFINFKDNHFLNGQYTVYGRVISGMEHVDAITRGEPPANPDRMISVRVASDA